MKGMTEEEAKKLKVDQDQKSFYVRWNANKQNYAMPEADRWFVREDGGVLIPTTFQEGDSGERPEKPGWSPSSKTIGRVKKESACLPLGKEVENAWV